MGRAFVAQLGDREVPIEITEAGAGRYQVKVDGQEKILDARSVGRTVSLLLEGRNYEVSVIRRGDDFDVLVSCHRFQFRLLPEERARRAQSRAGEALHGRRDVKASMPGKVVDLLVKVGDRVEAHQGLLIVEAMKMENEIHSPGAGEVKEIRVRPGQAVEAGEILAVIE